MRIKIDETKIKSDIERLKLEKMLHDLPEGIFEGIGEILISFNENSAVELYPAKNSLITAMNTIKDVNYAYVDGKVSFEYNETEYYVKNLGIKN